MKATFLNKVEMSYFVLVAVLFVLLFSESFAQNQKVSDLVKDKYALQNLRHSIQSEYDGVREVSIYLVGKYRFFETEEALLKQLKVEKNPDIKILIAVALYRMDSEKGMKELEMISSNEVDSNVRKVSSVIYNEYLVNNNVSKTAER